MEKVKEYILKAVKELKKIECECSIEKGCCDRCMAIMQLNSVHNFLSQ